jgi:hypothetical protein
MEDTSGRANDMNSNDLPRGWVNSALFNTNQNNIPLEELKPYWGKYVAWSRDGTTVRAFADTEEKLFVEMDRLGVPTDDAVVSFVDDPNEPYIP